MNKPINLYFSELAKRRWGQRDKAPIADTATICKLKEFGQKGGKDGNATFSAARRRAFMNGNEARWRIHKHYKGTTV